MKTNTRFTQSVITAAKDCDTTMPWARGKRRTAFIAKRAETKDAARRSG